MMGFFKNNRIKKLEEEIKTLKEDLKNTKDLAKQLHDSLCILTAAQYQIGNDVGVIYSTLKSLANPAAADDDLFAFKTDDDDKGYLN